MPSDTKTTSLTLDHGQPAAEPFRVLDDDGVVVGDAPAMDEDTARELFRLMLMVRAWDEKGVKLRHQGRVGEWYAWRGQEAQIASILALDEQDWVFPHFREAGVHFARGVSLRHMFEFACGLPRGWDPNEHRVAPFQTTMGTGLLHGVGFAHQLRRQGLDAATLVSFGDGSSSVGDFGPALNFAGVWRAPVVFFCANNQYAASVPIHMQTAGPIHARAQGYGLAGVLVDGMDPLAVYAATKAALERARAGDGATLIEGLMYRFGGHAAYEAIPTYRPEGELELWKRKDPINRFRAWLRESGWHDEMAEAEIAAAITDEMTQLSAEYQAESRIAPLRTVSLRNTFARPPRRLVEQVAQFADGVFSEADVWDPAPDPDLTGLATKPMNMSEALNAALHESMEADASIVLMGEDMVADGGVFKVTEGLPERFGLERVLDTPLAETGIVGTAVGMAMAGARPVPEIQFSGFVYAAFDQIVGQAARTRWRTGGRLVSPMVIRVAGGPGFGGLEFHADPPEALFAHVPGLVVVVPSNPVDAKGLLTAALRADDPVVMIEPIPLYFAKRQPVPEQPYEIPIGRARIARAGNDLTLVTYGRAVGACLGAAERAAADGHDVEVIDLRTIYPWDEQTVLDSVLRTGRLVIAHEAWMSHGVGAEIAATVAGGDIGALRAPIARVALPDVPLPPGRCEDTITLSPARIHAAVQRVLAA